jgi:transcriptional regulator with XRE-family HTH domain
MNATYGVRVSDTPEAATAWAAFVRKITTRTGWSVKRLADESTVNKSTIYRWLKGDTADITVGTIRLVAEAAKVDLEEALRAAAGVSDTADPGDWEIQMIQASGLDGAVVARLIRDVLERREEEEARRRRELERQIALARGADV